MPLVAADPARVGGAAAPAGAPPWRKRHPVVARAVLYGVLACVVGAASLLLAKRSREDETDRQGGYVTTIYGAELMRALDPAGALRKLREEVLAARPNDDVRRQALLAEAATLDSMQRFGEAEAAYAALAAAWPSGTPRGALTLPWANMRVRAGKPNEAMVLLDVAHAVDGEPEADVRAVRDAAARALDRAAATRATAGR